MNVTCMNVRFGSKADMAPSLGTITRTILNTIRFPYPTHRLTQVAPIPPHRHFSNMVRVTRANMGRDGYGLLPRS